MAIVRCPFCHRYIDESLYSLHKRQHLKKLSDGQQTDYATLPPDERFLGDLTGVPRAYIHRRCGTSTQMPEDIIRSYLANPYIYDSNRTYCCGCEVHVPMRECNCFLQRRQHPEGELHSQLGNTTLMRCFGSNEDGKNETEFQSVTRHPQLCLFPYN